MRKLLKAYRLVSAKMPGTPESKRALRSRVTAMMYGLGITTAFATVNPQELHSEMVMRLSGMPYGFDEFGRPDAYRPKSNDRYRLACGNPVACAMFFEAITRAYCEVFFGWPVGAQKQHNPECLFGEVRRQTHCWGLYLRFASYPCLAS